MLWTPEASSVLCFLKVFLYLYVYTQALQQLRQTTSEKRVLLTPLCEAADTDVRNHVTRACKKFSTVGCTHLPLAIVLCSQASCLVHHEKKAKGTSESVCPLTTS